jgi:hypothetical protein
VIHQLLGGRQLQATFAIDEAPKDWLRYPKLLGQSVGAGATVRHQRSQTGLDAHRCSPLSYLACLKYTKWARTQVGTSADFFGLSSCRSDAKKSFEKWPVVRTVGVRRDGPTLSKMSQTWANVDAGKGKGNRPGGAGSRGPAGGIGSLFAW